MPTEASTKNLIVFHLVLFLAILICQKLKMLVIEDTKTTDIYIYTIHICAYMFFHIYNNYRMASDKGQVGFLCQILYIGAYYSTIHTIISTYLVVDFDL